MHLDDYFDCHPLRDEDDFIWEGIKCKLVKMPHVGGACCKSFSYGLLIDDTDNKGPLLFISTDTLFQPELLEKISGEVDVIFHDCETSETRTTVHAHYEQLCALPDSIKNKTWLYHYQPNPGYDPHKDGFQGFIVKGQEFLFSKNHYRK